MITLFLQLVWMHVPQVITTHATETQTPTVRVFAGKLGARRTSQFTGWTVVVRATHAVTHLTSYVAITASGQVEPTYVGVGVG